MVFRALIDRLLGTTVPRVDSGSNWSMKSSKLSFDLYPELPNILYELLSNPNEPLGEFLPTKSSNMHSIESIYLGLDILSRGGTPPGMEAEMKSLVYGHFEHARWQTRQMAAVVFSSLLRTETFLADLREMLQPTYSQNLLHGQIMAACNMMNTFGRHYISTNGLLLSVLIVFSANFCRSFHFNRGLDKLSQRVAYKICMQYQSS
jgi:hypothetical protein